MTTPIDMMISMQTPQIKTTMVSSRGSKNLLRLSHGAFETWDLVKRAEWQKQHHETERVIPVIGGEIEVAESQRLLKDCIVGLGHDRH